MKNGLGRGTFFETHGMGREEVKRKKSLKTNNLRFFSFQKKESVEKFLFFQVFDVSGRVKPRKILIFLYWWGQIFALGRGNTF